MRNRISGWELFFAGLIFLAGTLLRLWHLDREAVDHFDEGVYSSVLWYDAAAGKPYPSRHAYAPPGLPFLIELAALFPVSQRLAPFVPAVLLGSLTPLVFGWTARKWYGQTAGWFALSVCALSEVHILYSRAALTDVPALFWNVLAIGVGSMAIQQSSIRTAATAGLCCGAGWWFKYTGWLPLAILWTGSIAWWIRSGRKTHSALDVLRILAVISVTALVVFAPWIMALQSHGGYSAVTANHASYAAPWSLWTNNLALHLSMQFWMDGYLGALSLGAGLLLGSLFRWTKATGSTWNPGLLLLLRFAGAGAGLAIVSLRVWTPLMLCCLAVGGGSGLILWPVLHRAFCRKRDQDPSPLHPGGLPLSDGDLASAPDVDPELGICLNLVWFAALLVVTPLYQPYARLFFPLLSAIWLAAAGGVGWWVESSLSVARRHDSGLVVPRRTWADSLVNALLGAAVGAAFVQVGPGDQIGIVPFEELMQSPLFQDRTSIERASRRLLDLAAASTNGVREMSAPEANVMVFPDDVLKRQQEEQETLPAASESDAAKILFFVYAEPGLLFQLNTEGANGIPTAELQLTPSPDAAATFLIVGPHAKRNATFWDEWTQNDRTLQWIGDVEFRPGMITLLDLFPPDWLRQHADAEVQKFELYRVIQP